MGSHGGVTDLTRGSWCVAISWAEGNVSGESDIPPTSTVALASDLSPRHRELSGAAPPAGVSVGVPRGSRCGKKGEPVGGTPGRSHVCVAGSGGSHSCCGSPGRAPEERQCRGRTIFQVKREAWRPSWPAGPGCQMSWKPRRTPPAPQSAPSQDTPTRGSQDLSFCYNNHRPFHVTGGRSEGWSRSGRRWVVVMGVGRVGLGEVRQPSGGRVCGLWGRVPGLPVALCSCPAEGGRGLREKQGLRQGQVYVEQGRVWD